MAKIVVTTDLELDENRMDQMKESYYSFEKFNKDVIKFQQEQDMLLKLTENNKGLLEINGQNKKIQLKGCK